MSLFIKKLFKGDAVVWILFTLLIVLSLVECFSALGTLAYSRANLFQPIIRHGGFLMVGFALVVALHHVPYKITGIIAPLAMIISIIFLILALFSGVELNDAKRWLDIFGIQFQPSEIAKVSLVMYIAWTMGKAHQNEDGREKAFWRVLIATGIIVLLIFTQNMSTAVMISLFAYLMLWIGGAPKKHMLYLTGIVAAFGLLAYIALVSIPDFPGVSRWSEWHSRLVSNEVDVLDPAYRLTDDNLQEHHAKIAISQGKFLGVLPGNSSQRDFLPQAYSDFIYAIIIEDLGWLGLLGVPLIYIMLLFRCRKIAQSCTRMVPALLVMGCGLIVSMQAFVNMAVAVGFFPVTGQALPLVSRGGTSGVITCLYFAIILSVSRFGASETEEEVWEAEDAAMAQAEAEHLAVAAEKIAQAEAAQQALSTEDYASMAE